MRILIIIIAFSSFISVQAQTPLPFSGMNYSQQGAFNHHPLLNDSNHLQKKWSVTGYGGIGAGFFNGGIAAFFPAQIGLQLNRRINNNLYAFAGVAATPVFLNFNRTLSSADMHSNYISAPGFNTHGLGVYSGIQAGLMYVNDAKTFSISGSIGISNSSPFYPANRISTQKQPVFTGARQ
jgi:hypothetical protein